MLRSLIGECSYKLVLMAVLIVCCSYITDCRTHLIWDLYVDIATKLECSRIGCSLHNKALSMPGTVLHHGFRIQEGAAEPSVECARRSEPRCRKTDEGL